MKLESLLVVLALVSAGCSEAKDDGDEDGGAGGSGGSGGAGAGSTDGGNSSDGGAADGAGPSDGGSTSSAPGDADLVINEITATEDWIELYNRGSRPFDLGGLGLADADGPGVPKLDEAIIFPAGTTVAAGGYLFILAKQDAVVMPGEQEPQTVCAPGSSPCFYAPFGLSDGDGDEIFLLDGEDILASGEYPPAAAAEPSTWCRVPDGTGDFAECEATPGASNSAAD